MVIEYIRYTVADEARGEELHRAYAAAARQLDAAPECIAYELTQCEEDAKAWILRIEWRSTEAHLQGFRKGAHFPAFLDAIRGFMSEIAEMRHYRLTEVQSRK
jgi:hemoglobin